MQHHHQKVYTINRGHKTLSVVHRQTHYVLGFKTPVLAKRIMYNLHPDPVFTLVRDNNIDLSPQLYEAGFIDVNLSIDVAATLFIPKCKGSPLDPMNDVGYHMNFHTEEEFIMFPINQNLGIIMPTMLQEECDEEYIFKAFVMDPPSRGLAWWKDCFVE